MLDYDFYPAQPSFQNQVCFFFHGLGADKKDLSFLRSLFPHYDCYFFSAPKRLSTLFQARLPSWYSWDKHFDLSSQNHQEMKDYINLIQSEVLSRYDTATHISALGFSQGGVMVLELGQYIELSEQMILCSFYPPHDYPRLPPSQGRTFFAYSDHDEVVPPTLSVSLAHALNHQNLSIKIYQDGHTISPQLLNDLKDFLIKSD